jgi:CO/xanthine dehydrogenase FAD-binding subunit
MAIPQSKVFFPAGFQELFSSWNSNPGAVLCAGGTEHIRNQNDQTAAAPRSIISLDKIEELRKISRSERYLEIGSMVKLSQIINLGKIVPEVLIRCLENIANPQLRSQATIGGNICNTFVRTDTSAPMIALDAQYELRSAQSARWVSASRFSTQPGPLSLSSQECLTRIRVPLEPWTFTWYRKFNFSLSSRPGGCILLILRNQKDILTDIRVLYSSQAILREKNGESMLMGKHLPLDHKDALAFVDAWKNYLSSMPEGENTEFSREYGNLSPGLIKTQILRFIESTLMHISD